MLLPLTSSGPLIKQVHGKTIRGTEAAPPTWKNEVKQVTEVNLKLTWNEKLERETVFACCQSSCKRGSFISLTIIERNANDFYRYSYIDSHQDVGECIYLDFVYLAVKIRCPRKGPLSVPLTYFTRGKVFLKQTGFAVQRQLSRDVPCCGQNKRLKPISWCQRE